MKDIATDIEHYCMANNIAQYTEGEIIYLLMSMQEMGLLQVSRARGDYWYRRWGLQVADTVYRLQGQQDR